MKYTLDRLFSSSSIIYRGLTQALHFIADKKKYNLFSVPYDNTLSCTIDNEIIIRDIGISY